MEDIAVSYKGESHLIHTSIERTRLAEFAELVSRKTGVDPAGAKFAGGGVRLIEPSKAPTKTLREAGVKPGAKLMLIGSSPVELAAVRNSRDLPGLAGFDHELRVHAARRRADSRSFGVKLPSGPHTFGGFEAWQAPGLHPPPSEAIKLLHRLAADSGIAGVMRNHGWAVGKLTEMPPEGKVGVSAVCLLGVNINAGQEISLRLRTDDLKGFRRYLSIRQTLCHELAHMEFGDHDLNFKRLNSQLCRECEQLSARSGVRLFEAAEGWQLDAPADPGNVMAATAASSGRTLRDLADGAPLPPAMVGHGGVADSFGVEALGHRDAATEATERAAERLGELPGTETPIARPPVDDAATHLDAGAQLAADSLQHAPESVSIDEREAAAAGNDMAAASKPAIEGLDTCLAEPATSSGPGVPGASNHEGGPAATVGSTQPSAEPTGLQADDPSAEYYGNAWRAVQRLMAGANPEDACTALQTIATILKNALQNPGQPKFRRVRQHNAAFFERAGRHPASLDLLRAAGFVSEREGPEDILRLSRDDPGLLWISLAACEKALGAIVPLPMDSLGEAR